MNRLRMTVDGATAERVRAWRAGGVDESIVAFCAAERWLEGHVEKACGQRRHIVVAASLCCGSRSLIGVLGEVTGFREVALCGDGVGTEDRVNAAHMPAFLAEDSVGRVHSRATVENIDRFRQMRVRPVVLVRDVFESLSALAAHLAAGGLMGPVATVPRGLPHWERGAQRRFVVCAFTPWILSFIASWQDAASHLPVLWVRFESFIREPVDVVREIMRHSGIEVFGKTVACAARRMEWSGHGVGAEKHGRAFMSNANERSMVVAMAASFKGVYDFSLIGL